MDMTDLVRIRDGYILSTIPSVSLAPFEMEVVLYSPQSSNKRPREDELEDKENGEGDDAWRIKAMRH